MSQVALELRLALPPQDLGRDLPPWGNRLPAGSRGKLSFGCARAHM